MSAWATRAWLETARTARSGLPLSVDPQRTRRSWRTVGASPGTDVDIGFTAATLTETQHPLKVEQLARRSPWGAKEAEMGEQAWTPTATEVDEILDELRPLIGRLARRSWEAITAEATRQELARAAH